MLATTRGYRNTFESSPGLRPPHFKLTWQLARTRGDRELLLSVQQSAAETLLHELREHVRKHDDKYRHEPKGPERDSWQRAIFLYVGVASANAIGGRAGAGAMRVKVRAVVLQDGKLGGVARAPARCGACPTSRRPRAGRRVDL